MRPRFPDGVPDYTPKRGFHGVTYPPVTGKRKQKPCDTSVDSSRTFLLARPHLVDSFFGHRPEKKDRYSTIVAESRRGVRHHATSRCWDRGCKVRSRKLCQSDEPEAAVDASKLSPIIHMVRPIPVFNGQNHKPAKRTAPTDGEEPPKKVNQKSIDRRRHRSAKLPVLSRSKHGGNLKHPAPKWVAETHAAGILSGFSSSDTNHAAHCVNGNIACSGARDGLTADRLRTRRDVPLNGASTSQDTVPRVRAMTHQSGSSATHTTREARSRSPHGGTHSRAVLQPAQEWTRALLDTGADCCICGEAFEMGRFIPIDALPQFTHLPQSSQGAPMDIVGMRLVPLRLGTRTIQLEFWVSASCRKTILSAGELLRKGLSCHMIGFDGTSVQSEIRVVGSIYDVDNATPIEYRNDHLWVYWSHDSVFWPGELPPAGDMDAPTVSLDTPWDVRVLLDSGSNVHTCPSQWVPAHALHTSTISSDGDHVLVDASGTVIPRQGYRQVRLALSDTAALTATYVVTPTVNEVILSIGRLLRRGVSIYLNAIGSSDVNQSCLEVGIMELGATRVPVRLYRNTTWFTATSGYAWPPSAAAWPLSPSSPDSHAMDDLGDAQSDNCDPPDNSSSSVIVVEDSDDASPRSATTAEGSRIHMIADEGAGARRSASDEAIAPEDFAFSQVMDAWDKADLPNTEDFNAACGLGDDGNPSGPVLGLQSSVADGGIGAADGRGSVAQGSREVWTPGEPAATQVPEETLVAAVPNWVSQEPASVPERAIERRSWPGAATSDQDFMEFFGSCNASNVCLEGVRPSEPNVGHSIMKSAARAIHTAQTAFPEASYHFVRMVAVCLITSTLRFPDYTLREHVLII